MNAVSSKAASLDDLMQSGRQDITDHDRVAPLRQRPAEHGFEDGIPRYQHVAMRAHKLGFLTRGRHLERDVTRHLIVQHVPVTGSKDFIYQGRFKLPVCFGVVSGEGGIQIPPRKWPFL